jgi:hypothetical protein
MPEKPAKDQKPGKNREERRREQFGKTRSNVDSQWPATEPNPAFGGDAVAGRPDQDQTDLTGPGTGGATQSDGPTPHVEGAKPGTKPKG